MRGGIIAPDPPLISYRTKSDLRGLFAGPFSGRMVIVR